MLVLETQRLRVRLYDPANPRDVEDAFRVYSDPEVSRYIGGTTQPDRESQRASLERVNARYRELGGGYGFWAIEVKEEGHVAGSLILKPLPGWPEIEIGWHLGRADWGRGYATEAGRAGLEYGFRTLELPRIVAVVNPANHRSLAVARRLGMEHRGRIRAYEKDVEYFVLEREPWLASSRTVSPSQ